MTSVHQTQQQNRRQASNSNSCQKPSRLPPDAERNGRARLSACCGLRCGEPSEPSPAPALRPAAAGSSAPASGAPCYGPVPFGSWYLGCPFQVGLKGNQKKRHHLRGKPSLTMRVAQNERSCAILEPNAFLLQLMVTTKGCKHPSRGYDVLFSCGSLEM